MKDKFKFYKQDGFWVCESADGVQGIGLDAVTAYGIWLGNQK